MFPYLGESAERAASVLASYAEIRRTGIVYPRHPVPLPDGAAVVCTGYDERLAEDVRRWHGAEVVNCLPKDAERLGFDCLAVLTRGTRLRGSLVPAFAALADGWDRVNIQTPYYRYGEKSPLFIEYDPRAYFYRAGGDPHKAWLMHPSFALEWEP